MLSVDVTNTGHAVTLLDKVSGTGPTSNKKCHIDIASDQLLSYSAKSRWQSA